MSSGYVTEKSTTLLTTRTFTVVSDIVRVPEGHTMERFVVRHPGAVVILPVTAEGKCVAIKQYRHAIAETILEFPAGTLEAGELPADCAAREIQEEIGYAATSWKDLGVLVSAPGFCDEKLYAYLAQGLHEQNLPGDEDEDIEVVELTKAEVEAAIRSGEMKDAKSIVAYARALLLGYL